MGASFKTRTRGALLQDAKEAGSKLVMVASTFGHCFGFPASE
jgi:hypothetical protein